MIAPEPEVTPPRITPVLCVALPLAPSVRLRVRRVVVSVPPLAPPPPAPPEDAVCPLTMDPPRPTRAICLRQCWMDVDALERYICTAGDRATHPYQRTPFSDDEIGQVWRAASAGRETWVLLFEADSDSDLATLRGDVLEGEELRRMLATPEVVGLTQRFPDVEQHIVHSRAAQTAIPTHHGADRARRESISTERAVCFCKWTIMVLMATFGLWMLTCFRPLGCV